LRADGRKTAETLAQWRRSASKGNVRQCDPWLDLVSHKAGKRKKERTEIKVIVERTVLDLPGLYVEKGGEGGRAIGPKRKW